MCADIKMAGLFWPSRLVPCCGGSWDLATCIVSTVWLFCDVFHLPQAFGVFGLCQIHAFIDYLRSKLSRAQFETLFWSLTVLVVSAVVIVGGALTFMGSE